MNGYYESIVHYVQIDFLLPTRRLMDGNNFTVFYLEIADFTSKKTVKLLSIIGRLVGSKKSNVKTVASFKHINFKVQ